jgi:hypothetical protein
VLGGRRLARVIKDGYATFEGAVDVRVGETTHLDAVLRPLARAGQLRLEAPTNDGPRLDLRLVERDADAALALDDRLDVDLVPLRIQARFTRRRRRAADVASRISTRPGTALRWMR